MALDGIVDTFGPFLIPATLFVIGIVGYGILILLTRYGILPGRRDP
jgi:hypothetical protein